MIRAAASERNRQPILDILKSLFAKDVKLNALEIASGTGQHVSHFAKHFRNVVWRPTDIDVTSLSSIEKYVESENLTNVEKPMLVDVSLPIGQWPAEVSSKLYDMILCINMIHISPMKATEGLFAAAGNLLSPAGILLTYGPYAVSGVLEPLSNVQFDQSLRARNTEWGVRDTRDLEKLAGNHKLRLTQIFDMPANNKILVFRRSEYL